MKLYNKTKYPDELLEAVLVEAGRAVGARTSKVIVKVTSAKPGYVHCRGIATKCDYVKRFFLDTRAYRKGTHKLKEGIVETDGGYLRLTVPYPKIPDWIKNSDIYPRWLEAHQAEPENIASLIFSVAAHEWRHIKQYQTRMFRDRFSVKQEQAKRHDNRAWEKDATRAASKAEKRNTNNKAEAITNLITWLEEQYE